LNRIVLKPLCSQSFLCVDKPGFICCRGRLGMQSGYLRVDQFQLMIELPGTPLLFMTADLGGCPFAAFLYYTGSTC
jgi:hypothetical protein